MLIPTIGVSVLLSITVCGAGASYVPCAPCDQKAVSVCPPVPRGCQPVKEPGCGCCLTCALEEGQPCGVYTGPCTRGLRCLPKHGEEKPLHALLHGRGLCKNEKTHKSTHAHKDGRSDPSLRVPQPAQTKVPLYGGHMISRKAQAMKHAKDRKNQLARLGPSTNMDFSPPIGPSTNMDFSPLTLHNLEPEFGPCRRRLDHLIQSMKDTSRVMALSLYVPNCDKKGFFKRKQCKPSRGRKRGICWCVDRFGVKVPGVNYSGGDLQCKDLETNNNSNQ